MRTCLFLLQRILRLPIALLALGSSSAGYTMSSWFCQRIISRSRKEMPCQVCQSLSFFLKVLQVWSLPIHSHLTSAKTTSRRGALDVWLWKVSTSSAALKSEVNFKKQRLKWSELQCTATLCLYFSFLVSDLMWFLSKIICIFAILRSGTASCWLILRAESYRMKKTKYVEMKVCGDRGWRLWQKSPWC